MKVGTCKYFSGIQHKECYAGVQYLPFLPSVTKKELPCFSPALSENGKVCPKREDPTSTEIAAQEEARIASLNRLRVVMTALAPLRKERKGKGGHGSLSCPTGCGGILHWSMAQSNGHMAGHCSTVGCVSWME